MSNLSQDCISKYAVFNQNKNKLESVIADDTIIPFFSHISGDFKCLSQFYPVSFIIDGIKYNCAEQWIMASKARLFPGNDNILNEIMTSTKPLNIKTFGRMVANFDDAVWSEKRFDIVVAGNYAKFSQNEDLKKILLDTGNALLAEASPLDKIWGIGLSINNPDIATPSLWNGINLLGKALMEVRTKLHE
jgi:hypothetical protein